MDEDVDRCVRLLGRVDVELLDVGRTVGDATRRAEAGQRCRALLGVALGDFSSVGSPWRLVVGKVDLVLVVVEKDERTLRLWRDARRQMGLHLLGQHRSCHRDCRSHQRHAKVLTAVSRESRRSLALLQRLPPLPASVP